MISPGIAETLVCIEDIVDECLSLSVNNILDEDVLEAINVKGLLVNKLGQV